MRRGEVWWAHLSEPRGSEPGFRRPVVIVSADSFNRSRIQTVLAAVITSKMKLAEAPGNVALTCKQSGLPKPSVINVSQIITLDKSYLTERVGTLQARQMSALESGLRLVFSL
jgi:mRNA interferase MazF